jgi:hypothetical protein
MHLVVVVTVVHSWRPAHWYLFFDYDPMPPTTLVQADDGQDGSAVVCRPAAAKLRPYTRSYEFIALGPLPVSSGGRLDGSPLLFSDPVSTFTPDG